MNGLSVHRISAHGCVKAFAAVLLLSWPGRAHAQEVEKQVLFGPGLMHLRRPPRSGYGSLEFDGISSNGWLGGWATCDGYAHGAFLGAGALVRLDLARGLSLLAGSGPGFVTDEATSKLGFRFQFRSSVGICWKLSSRRSLAVTVSHYSDGGMSRLNPGVEGVRILYGVAF